ncbi:MAG: helix-turn-helix domain-containing protein [Hungatella hathewayi]|nr:helix-turn-helix domain-containing protein [Hungatella hathewayi]
MGEEYGNKGLRQVIREIFGTDQVDELREIARKARSYDKIMSRQRPVNVRGAGRRGKFMDDDVDLMIELYQQGKTVQYLAEFFDTSRQTIYKYLASEKRFLEDPFITMRMHYLYEDQVCTVIDVDFMHKKIYIRNKTKDILHRAFGVLEEPTWEDFEDFLESRCFPRSRANLKNILRDIGVPSYDPLQIIEKTGGRMAEDHQWIQIFYKGDDKGGGNDGDGDS